MHVLSLVLLIGCGTAKPSVQPSALRHPSPTQSTAAETAAPTPLLTLDAHHAVEVAGWRAHVLSPATSHRAWRGEGETLVALGGHRVVVANDGNTRIAEDQFANTLLGAVPVSAGWVFLTSDGVLWHSTTFLGRPVARELIEHPLSLEGFGCAAIVTASGELVWSDGERVERVGAPPDVSAATCLNAQTLAVVLAGARVVLSTDRGRSWTPVESSPGSADVSFPALELGPEGVRVNLGDSGKQALLRWPDRPPPNFLAPDDSRDAQARALAAVRERSWFAFPPDETAPTIRGPGGSPVPIQGLPTDCVSMETRPLRSYACFGTRESVHVVGADGQARRVGMAPPLPVLGSAEVFMAADGSALVYLGDSCFGRRDQVRHSFACVLDLVSGRRTSVRIPVESNRGYFIGAHDGSLLFDGWETGTSFFLSRAGRLQPIVAPPGLSGAILRDSAVTSDGYFSATALLSSYSEAPPRVVGVVGEMSSGTVRTFDLPQGAMAVAFRDRHRAVAAGSDLDHLWVSDDAGTSWQPLRPPFEGSAQAITLVGQDVHECGTASRSRNEWPEWDPQHLALFRLRNRLQGIDVEEPSECASRYGDGWLRCDSSGCLVHDRVWVGEAELVPPQGRLLAAPRVPFLAAGR